MHDLFPNLFWWLQPNHSLKKKYNSKSHHHHQNQPFLWDHLGAQFEYIVLQMVLIIKKFIPKPIISKLLKPIVGFPTHAPVHQVLPIEDCMSLLDNLENQGEKLYIGICPCRRAQGEYVKDGNGYNVTDLCIGRWGKNYQKYNKDSFTEISYEQAKKYLVKFDNFGLVHTVFTACPTKDMQSVMCNCDTRVCVPLNFYKELGLASFWKSPYELIYDPEKCKGCQKCVDICPVNARTWCEKKKMIEINEEKCIGCGICRTICVDQANSLIKHKIIKNHVMI